VLGAILEAHEQGRPLRVLITASTYNAADNVLLPVHRRLRDHLPAIPVQVARLRSHWRSREPGLPAEIDQVINVRSPSSDQLELCASLAEKTGIILVSGPPEQIYNLLVAQDQPVCQPLFDLILFDEASQTDVAHAILPLCALVDGGSVVLAGDPLQLPPIHQPEPPRNLEAMVGSIYEFCEQQHGIQPEMLEVNYRSNALLVELARTAGYRSGLRSFSEELRLSLVEPLPLTCPSDWPSDLFWSPEWSTLLDPDQPAVCFVYPEGQSSQWNRFEADAVTALLTLLQGRLASRLTGECDAVTGGILPSSTTTYSVDDFWRQAVGVVTPHRAQRALIIERLRRLHGASVLDRRLIADAVDTVERFQGQQRDVIVATFALGDPDAIRDEDEFLLSLNRFNVMASRARAKLIVLVSQEIVDYLSSDLETLRQSRLLKAYVESFCRRGRPMTLGWIHDGMAIDIPGLFRAR
jgi:DNA replication ATP-dependent helicase/nuclease Dna2